MMWKTGLPRSNLGSPDIATTTTNGCCLRVLDARDGIAVRVEPTYWSVAHQRHARAVTAKRAFHLIHHVADHESGGEAAVVAALATPALPASISAISRAAARVG